MSERKLAVAALRKLPKRLLRAAIQRVKAGGPCFVTACASRRSTRYTDAMWRRFARAHGLTWNGYYITGEGSEVTALSQAWEYDRRWFRRVLLRRLAV